MKKRYMSVLLLSAFVLLFISITNFVSALPPCYCVNMSDGTYDPSYSSGCHVSENNCDAHLGLPRWCTQNCDGLCNFDWVSITPLDCVNGVCFTGNKINITVYTFGIGCPSVDYLMVNGTSSDGSCKIFRNGTGTYAFNGMGKDNPALVHNVSKPETFIYTLPTIPSGCIGKNISSYTLQMLEKPLADTTVYGTRSSLEVNVPFITGYKLACNGNNTGYCDGIPNNKSCAGQDEATCIANGPYCAPQYGVVTSYTYGSTVLWTGLCSASTTAPFCPAGTTETSATPANEDFFCCGSTPAKCKNGTMYRMLYSDWNIDFGTGDPLIAQRTCVTPSSGYTGCSGSMPDTSTSCAYITNQASCPVTSGCSWKSCTPNYCGDGVTGGIEDCDLGDALHGSGNGACPSTCSHTCTFNDCTQRIFAFNYTVPSLPLMCSNINLTNVTSALYNGPPPLNVKSDYFVGNINPIRLFDREGNCSNAGWLSDYDTFADGFPEVQYFGDPYPFFGVRDNSTNGCYKGSCTGGNFYGLQFMQNASGNWGVNVTTETGSQEYYCGEEDTVCPDDFNWNGGCTYRNNTYLAYMSCAPDPSCIVGPPPPVGAPLDPITDRTYPNQESFDSPKMLNHMESFVCSDICTPVYAVSKGVCASNGQGDPDCHAQIGMKCGNVSWQNKTNFAVLYSKSCVVPNPIPHAYCNGVLDACVINEERNNNISQCVYNTDDSTNEMGYPITCRGLDDTNATANTWCVKGYTLPQVDTDCVSNALPCNDKCPYVTELGERYKKAIFGDNISILRELVEDNETWQNFTKQYINYVDINGNLSCFKWKNGTKNWACGIENVYPPEFPPISSWMPVQVWYNGSVLRWTPPATGCGSGCGKKIIPKGSPPPGG